MIGYLPKENEFVGREWLLEILETKIVHDRMSKGTLLVADYGFGKSAIVSQLLCAKENENGWMLRRHIIAFHVCFDSHDLTKNPVLLIRRLIWFLSKKSIQYSKHIETQNNTFIFDDNKCANDISACFDHAITLPLKDLPEPDDAPWIIIIDALDECSDSDERNQILDLLSKKLFLMQIDLPKWLKWMITSKKRYENSLEKLTTLEIDYMDPRNLNDIKLYLMKRLNLSDAHLIQQFADKSQGNILYLSHSLKYIIKSGNVSLQNFINLPNNIKLLYELNFNRLFETNNDFEVAKIILQLISVQKMSTDTVFEILETNELCNKSEFSRIMRKLDLYLSSDYFVTFKHNSIYEWLISNSSKTYNIYLSAGHSMFSNYLFTCSNISHIRTLRTLVYHVAKSDDEYVKINFFYLKIKKPVAELYLDLCPSASVKSFQLLSEYIKHKETRSHLLDRFLKVASSCAIRNDRVDIVSHIHEHEKEITNIIQFPLIKASKFCSKNIFMYLVDVVGVFYDEYVIDTLFSNRCMDILETFVPRDALVINTRTIDKAIFECNSYYDIKDIIMLSVVNNMELVCDDDLIQWKKMLELTSYVAHFPRHKSLHPSLLTNSPLHTLAQKPFYQRRYILIADSVRMFITKYPQLLSCRFNGLTPFLYYIVISDDQLFSILLTNNVLNEQCQSISNGWLYLHFTFMKYFKYDISNYVDTMMILDTYYPCPAGASVEHLLMKYKRIEMISIIIASGYVMNWTKTDLTGRTPLDYADDIFIMQLECHFSVDIHVLSDKEMLIKLCLCEWFYVYFLFAMVNLVLFIAFLYITVFCSIKTVLHSCLIVISGH
ncbi:uncharacterized protein LOC132730582 [Ruditapes philippinarum]|uniref:uncharacterized protein LOC132730582 n=1 Tax=Ruditapes philippinarum TaxID=129788 RepID=UPI00295ACFFC|nr:uncharacterized protein LOC132730582 [Ruditapes philippinarum]